MGQKSLKLTMPFAAFQRGLMALESFRVGRLELANQRCQLGMVLAQRHQGAGRFVESPGGRGVAEKVMRRFKSPRQLQRFTAVHDPLANLFMHCRYHTDAKTKRMTRFQALLAWEAASAAKPFSTGRQAA